jgi:hypothetical protein
MAAVSGLLQAIERTGIGTVCLRAGSYKETLELLARSGMQTRVGSAELCEAHAKGGVLWLDSSCGARPSGGGHDFDLIICDTTCFGLHSGRISRLVALARRERTPLVLVRSQ